MRVQIHYSKLTSALEKQTNRLQIVSINNVDVLKE